MFHHSVSVGTYKKNYKKNKLTRRSPAITLYAPPDADVDDVTSLEDVAVELLQFRSYLIPMAY